MSEARTFRIDSIAAGGDGVGRADGLVVFVPRTAPGDLVTAWVESKGRFGRGILASIEEPSPRRVTPPCPHYTVDRCGGCQLQHLGYDAQLGAKRTIVHEALRRIGGHDVAAPEVRPSPVQWRYRSKLTLALRRTGDTWIAGLHPYDAPGRVFDLADCPITDERVVAAWRTIHQMAELLPDATALRGAVHLLGDSITFALEGGRTWPLARSFFDAVPAISALWWTADRRRRRLLHDRYQHRVPGASFAQVNPAAATMLGEHVVERILAHSPAHVIDAYAGNGDTAVALAERGVRVSAIELDAEAAVYGASRLPTGSRYLTGRVEDRLGELLPADVIVLNPPRGGVDQRVANEIVRASPAPRAIVYVSCNPATLARDLARMPGYRVESLVSFDMFPQTAHVETVCELIREAP